MKKIIIIAFLFIFTYTSFAVVNKDDRMQAGDTLVLTSLTSTVGYSGVINLGRSNKYSVEIIITDTATSSGSFYLESSNDSSTWHTLSSTDVNFTTSTNYQYLIDDAFYKKLRVKYTITSSPTNVSIDTYFVENFEY